MQYHFGSGQVWGRKVVTTGVPTPVRFGALQDISVDISYSTKQLYGQKIFPLEQGRGTGKITCKARLGQFNAQAFNDIIFGESTDPVTGRIVTIDREAQTITANNATVTNNATFLRDLGVIYAANGGILNRANAPVGDQYTVNESTGVYSFNNSINNQNVRISYQYNDAANGKTISISNQDLGSSPTFLAVLRNNFRNKNLALVLNACVSEKLGLATKLDDFVVPEFDFQALADASDQVGKLCLDE